MLPVVALIASLLRWNQQGSGNLYTALHKQFWVEHPDFGWTISDRHPLWLGLEVIAVILAIACGLAIGGFIIRRRERKTKRPAKVLRTLAWIFSVLPVAVPVAAFASGFGPARARDTRPIDTPKVTPTEQGIAGSLPLPAGTYEVVAHRQGSVITAQLKAGGESFTAVFGDAKGTATLDPRDLTKPVAASASISSPSVDTGISGRSTSAREYLQSAKFPRIGFKLERLVAASQDSPTQVTYRAAGTVELAGRTHIVEIAGTLKQLDAAALARLELSGDVLLVQGDFSLIIKETVLAPDAADFNTDTIPIHVSLVLRHTNG